MNEERFVKERKKDKEALDRRQRDSAVLDVETDEPWTKAGFTEVLKRVSRKTNLDSQRESEDSDETE
jgi:hypothetical protein